MQSKETTLITPTAGKDEADILLAPFFLVRIAGLPFNVLDQLQFPRTVALIDEVLSIEAWLENAREQLLTRLNEYLQQCLDRSLQHTCLDMRRAILQGKGRRVEKLLQTMAAHLSPEFATALEAWCGQAIRHAELIASGEATLQQELSACRQALRQIFRHENLQRGLLLSSPTLYAELQHYLTTPAHLSNNRSRRVEEGLLSYLIRMITKPSPYSTFASTSPGTWRDGDAPATRLDIGDWNQKSVVRFHVGLLNSIVCALAKRPEIRPYLRPVLNTTMQWLSSPPPDHQIAGTGGENAHPDRIECLVIQKAGLRQHHYREYLIRLRLNKLHHAIVSTIEQAQAALTYRDVIEKLMVPHTVRKPGRSDTMQDGQAHSADNSESAARSYSEEEIMRALECLTERGVLTIALDVPDHEDDKLACVINRLASIPGAWASRIRSMFQELRAMLETYASSAATRRHHLLLAIRQQTYTICDEIGSDPASSLEISQEIEKIFPNLILEDTTLAARELTLNRASWEPLLKDLCVLQEIAPLLEGSQIWQLIAGCLARATQTAPGAFQDDILNYHLQLSTAYKNPQLSSPQLRVLRSHLAQYTEARQALTRMFARRVQQANTHGLRVLALDSCHIHSFAQSLPAFLRQRYPLAYFGQLFSEQGRHQMMVNLAWPGPGTIFSRFSYLFGDSSRGSEQQHSQDLRMDTFAPTPPFLDSVRAYIAGLERRHGRIYAAISETGGFNVNIHAPLTRYEIAFPGTISLHPATDLLSLRDLKMFRNPETLSLQLVSRSLGAQIAPIHVGFSVVNVLPPLYQTLVTPNSHYPGFNPVVLIEAALQPEQKQQKRYYPRIVLGHAVLSRATWKIPRSYLPLREAGETAFDYFLKVNRWRVAQGLPQEGFWRVLSRAEQRIVAQNEYVARLLAEDQPLPDAAHNLSADGVGQPDTHTDAHSFDWRETPDVHSLFKDDALRKPFYINFHNYFLLSLFQAAIQAIPEGQSLTFEEMLPTRNHALLHHDTGDYATEFALEFSR